MEISNSQGIDAMKASLEEFLSSGNSKFECNHFPYSLLVEVIDASDELELDYDSWETNGWDVDWWIKIKNKEGKEVFDVAGGLYSGEFKITRL